MQQEIHDAETNQGGKRLNDQAVKPEKSFKAGAVRAAIWTNPRRNRDGQLFYSRKVIVDRTYKDGSGNFQHTSGLEPNDIPKAILVLNKAYDYLNGNETTEDDHREPWPVRAQVP
jgi:hypothetical protein